MTSLTSKVVVAGGLIASGATFDDKRDYVNPEEKTRIAVEQAVNSVEPVVKVKTSVIKLEEGHHKADRYLIDNNTNITKSMTNEQVTAYIKSVESKANTFERQYLEQKQINVKLAKQIDKTSTALGQYMSGVKK